MNGRVLDKKLSLNMTRISEADEYYIPIIISMIEDS